MHQPLLVNNASQRRNKSILRIGSVLSIVIGICLLIYSKTDAPPASRFNVLNLDDNMYQAEVTCDRNDLLELLTKCGVTNYIIPPMCEHFCSCVTSAGPVVFECKSSDYINQFNIKYTSYSKVCLYLGIIFILAPFIIICGMFVIIGVHNYYKQQTSLQPQFSV